MSSAGVTLKEFFEGVKAGRLTGLKCGKCGELAIPPKEFCPACGARAWERAPLSGNGTITSYTVIRIAPSKHADQAPYAVGVVSLAEGVSLFGRLVEIPLDRLAIGTPVKFRPQVVRDQTVVAFGPA